MYRHPEIWPFTTRRYASHPGSHGIWQGLHSWQFCEWQFPRGIPLPWTSGNMEYWIFNIKLTRPYVCLSVHLSVHLSVCLLQNWSHTCWCTYYTWSGQQQPEHWPRKEYRQTSNISCTLTGNKIVDHSDVVEASPVGAAPTTSSFST